jgi:hypothetical protein
MSVIAIRQHAADGTPSYGSGAYNYLYDIDAMPQIIADTIALELGTWWENANLGVPVLSKIIGSSPETATIPLILQQAVAALPYVASVSNVTLAFDRVNRQAIYSATVTTSFGTVAVAGQYSTGSIG